MIKHVTLIKGDGIGPEITEAVLKIINASEKYLKENSCWEEESVCFEEALVGEKIYHQNVSSGIDEKAWKIIKKNSVLLKAPITTPMGGGYKSLNVTLRKTLGLFANLRPSISYYPVIQNSPEKMDIVVVRENEEDLYAGIEYRQTNNSFTSLKLLTKAGSLKICHFAFEYARANGRKKVTCMIKDNIMKITDGMFYSAFLEVAKYYPDIEHDRYIIDIGCARVASKPDIFDVIVTENLYGDIISDITSEISGSVGMTGSANIGEKYSMFEAIHGSAPAIAGKNEANPSAFLNAAILMLKHLKMLKKATLIENALFKTLKLGLHTKDIYNEKTSKKKLGTAQFADEIIKNFSNESLTFDKKNQLCENKQVEFNASLYEKFLLPDQKKELIGFDLFIDIKNISSTNLAEKILECLKKNDSNLKNGAIKLSSLMSRGLKIWPFDSPENEIKDEFCDYWMCRFMFDNKVFDATQISNNSLIKNHLLLINQFIINLIDENHFDITKVENLYKFTSNEDDLDFSYGFSSGQGE